MGVGKHEIYKNPEGVWVTKKEPYKEAQLPPGWSTEYLEKMYAKNKKDFLCEDLPIILKRDRIRMREIKKKDKSGETETDPCKDNWPLSKQFCQAGNLDTDKIDCANAPLGTQTMCSIKQFYYSIVSDIEYIGMAMGVVLGIWVLSKIADVGVAISATTTAPATPAV